MCFYTIYPFGTYLYFLRILWSHFHLYKDFHCEYGQYRKVPLPREKRQCIQGKRTLYTHFNVYDKDSDHKKGNKTIS